MTLKDRIEMTRARLNRYREAEDAILSAQSYSLDGMSLTRANLPHVQKMINDLENELSRLTLQQHKATRSRMRVVVPSDGLNMQRMRAIT